MKLVIATRNKDKLIEIKDIISQMRLNDSLEILSLSDFQNVPEVIEDGKTLQENAIKKIKSTYNVLKLNVLAEDTGLEVEYLNGKPGVYSARFAGPGCSYSDNVEKLLSLLKGVPLEKRTASFRCVAGVSINGHIYTREGIIPGYIATEPRGENGFGYDPVFIPLGYDKSFAELPQETKNKISHRVLAILKLKPVILESIKEF